MNMCFSLEMMMAIGFATEANRDRLTALCSVRLALLLPRIAIGFATAPWAIAQRILPFERSPVQRSASV